MQRIVKQAVGWKWRARRAGQEVRLQLLLSPQGFVGLFLSQPEKEAREDRVVILGFFSLLQSCSMLRAMGGGGRKKGVQK